MNKQKLIILISTLIIFLSSFIVFFELKSYTPVNKDETEIINNYDKITREMNKLIEERKEEEKHEKAIQEFIEWTKRKNQETENSIKKYGIKKEISYGEDKKANEAARDICEYYNYETAIKVEYKDFMCGIEEVYATKFDFNDDGIEESIGYKRGYCGAKHCSINILQKKNGKLINIFNIGPWINPYVTILNHKTNGYYDFFVSSWKESAGVVYENVIYDATKKEYDFTD